MLSSPLSARCKFTLVHQCNDSEMGSHCCDVNSEDPGCFTIAQTSERKLRPNRVFKSLSSELKVRTSETLSILKAEWFWVDFKKTNRIEKVLYCDIYLSIRIWNDPYRDLGFRPYRTALLLNVYNSVLLELFLVRSFQAKATEFISYFKTNKKYITRFWKLFVNMGKRCIIKWCMY